MAPGTAPEPEEEAPAAGLAPLAPEPAPMPAPAAELPGVPGFQSLELPLAGERLVPAPSPEEEEGPLLPFASSKAALPAPNAAAPPQAELQPPAESFSGPATLGPWSEPLSSADARQLACGLSFVGDGAQVRSHWFRLNFHP